VSLTVLAAAASAIVQHEVALAIVQHRGGIGLCSWEKSDPVSSVSSLKFRLPRRSETDKKMLAPLLATQILTPI
jgi:hypothetical protein